MCGLQADGGGGEDEGRAGGGAHRWAQMRQQCLARVLVLSSCMLRLSLPAPCRDPTMPTLAVANALLRKHSDGILDFAQL